MLTLSEISKAYGGRILFADAALQVNRADRIGLVGPNGAGKTTLFSIILGTESADSGDLTRERGITIGYLPQESAPTGDETVIELATAVTPDFVKLRRVIKAWEADHPSEALHAEEIHDNAHDRYHELGGYRLEARAKQILAGLGFRERDFERPARELSGGWVMRAHLARLLVQEPDLLMLDEPTNHLDLEALLWLQDYLQHYPGAIVVISHDREFLNRLVGSIVEIRQCKLLRYRGNYDDYLEQRAAHEEQLVAAFKNQEREIARLMEFVNRFRAKNTKATQAQAKLKQIDRMEKVAAPTNDEKKIDFKFPQPQRVTEQFVRTLLGCFLFRGDDVFKQVSVLSGGEKSRLALVKLLLDPPNLLLMDEPTTHLDMASIDALAYALDQFSGTLIFISHDVYFIRALANHVVHVNAGQLTHYPGGYQYYLDKTKASSERAALTATGKYAPHAAEASRRDSPSGQINRPASPAATRKDQKRLEAEQRQARSRERKVQQEIVDRLEAEIQQLEKQVTELTADLENPATYEKPGRAVVVNRELLHAQERLAELNPEWETEAGKLSAIQ
jgi:ATPase subunit of ABC transporter with duplicated ATPase domains